MACKWVMVLGLTWVFCECGCSAGSAFIQLDAGLLQRVSPAHRLVHACRADCTHVGSSQVCGGCGGGVLGAAGEVGQCL